MLGPTRCVLSIAHTAVNRAAGRLRYHPFANDGSLDVTLVVPSRWHQFGRWLTADPADDPGARVVPLPIRLPRAGPASWYLHTYRGLARQVRASRPEVIHLWEEPWSLVALQASLLARRTGAALVLEVDQDIMKRLPPPFEWIRRRRLVRWNLPGVQRSIRLGEASGVLIGGVTVTAAMPPVDGPLAPEWGLLASSVAALIMLEIGRRRQSVALVWQLMTAVAAGGAVLALLGAPWRTDLSWIAGELATAGLLFALLRPTSAGIVASMLADGRFATHVAIAGAGPAARPPDAATSARPPICGRLPPRGGRTGPSSRHSRGARRGHSERHRYRPVHAGRTRRRAARDLPDPGRYADPIVRRP